MSCKTRMKFMGRVKIMGSDGEEAYVWQSERPLPGDSRYEEIRCPVEWFWSPNPMLFRGKGRRRGQ